MARYMRLSCATMRYDGALLIIIDMLLEDMPRGFLLPRYLLSDY